MASGNVTISAAYDAATAQIIEVKAGNTTDVKLNAPVVARFVNVTIEGSYSGDGPGGTIAEFAALG